MKKVLLLIMAIALCSFAGVKTDTIAAKSDIVVIKDTTKFVKPVKGNVTVTGNVEAAGIYSVYKGLYSSTKVGWATTSEAYTQYQVIGDLVTVTFYITGVSNSQTTSITLPYAAYSNSAYGVSFTIQYIDNSGNVLHGCGSVNYNTDVANFYPSADGSTTLWTASGVKMIQGQFSYIK